MSPLSLALIVAAFGFALGALMTIGFCVRFGLTTGLRWAQNWPSATTFLLSSYAMAVGLFVYMIASGPSVMPSGRLGVTLLVVSAVVVAIIVVANAYTDFMTEDVPPVILNTSHGQSAEALRLEQHLRRHAAEAHRKSPDRKAYAKLVRPFEDFRGLVGRANWLAYLLFLENLQGGLLAAAFLLYAIDFALVVPDTQRGAVPQQLEAILLLMITWYPLRFYSQWYQRAIYRENATSQRLFWILVVVAMVAAITMFFIAHPQPTIAVISALFASIAALLSTAKVFNWKWVMRLVQRCADGLADCPFSYYALLYAVIVALCGVIANSALSTSRSAGAPAVQAGVEQNSPTKK